MKSVAKIFKFFKKYFKYLVLIITYVPLIYYVLIHYGLKSPIYYALKKEYEILRCFKYWDYLKIMKFVKKNYPEEVSEGELMISSIYYMTYVLDKYSVFYPSDKYEKKKKLDEGYYEDYGLYLIEDNGDILVFNVVENSPSYNKGVRIGDYFLKINEKKVKGLKTKDISKILSESESCKIQFLRKKIILFMKQKFLKGKLKHQL